MELSGYEYVSGNDGLVRYGFIYSLLHRPTMGVGEGEGPLIACR